MQIPVMLLKFESYLLQLLHCVVKSIQAMPLILIINENNVSVHLL